MRLLLAGASGFLARALREHLAQEGHEVVRLVRGEPLSPEESHWDPRRGYVDHRAVERVDAVVNLAGAPLARWPWTAAYVRELRDSRIGTTRTLADAIARSERMPAFVAQSAIGRYGDRGEEVLTEDSEPRGGTVLSDLTADWEAATEPAAQAGARVCIMRTAPVLDRRSLPLQAMVPVFRAGLGGRIGSGRQYFSSISLRDWVRAASFLVQQDRCDGVYNLAGPGATTNRELTRELGSVLHRPTPLVAPAWPLRAVLGELSKELLASLRVEPARLTAAGFEFEHPTLHARLRAALDA